MTVWIMHLELSAQEEANVEQRLRLLLPFEGMPDLSRLNSVRQCKDLVQLLHPDAPPETISRLAERVWRIFATLQKEDIIAVPLPHSRQLALASVTDGYTYRVDEKGEDEHSIGVTWYARRVSLSRFKKHKELFAEGKEQLVEVENKEARATIHTQLPYSYNRFAKIKWILLILLMLKLVGFALHQVWQKM